MYRGRNWRSRHWNEWHKDKFRSQIHYGLPNSHHKYQPVDSQTSGFNYTLSLKEWGDEDKRDIASIWKVIIHNDTDA